MSFHRAGAGTFRLSPSRKLDGFDPALSEGGSVGQDLDRANLDRGADSAQQLLKRLAPKLLVRLQRLPGRLLAHTLASWEVLAGRSQTGCLEHHPF